MMMRFNKVINDIKEAMLQFCMEQSVMNGYSAEEEIQAVVKSAFDVFDKNQGTSLPVEPVYRYSMYAGEQFTDEILPAEIKENGELFERAIFLGSFLLDSYSSDTCESNLILRGYDVVYDINSKEIVLLYRIMTTDDDITTVYRVDTDIYEDFDVFEFVIDISAQIIIRLKQSLSIPNLSAILKEAA